MYFLVFKLICLKVGAKTKGHRVPMKRLHMIYKTIKIFDFIYTYYTKASFKNLSVEWPSRERDSN
jgi:hypothetical protein